MRELLVGMAEAVLERVRESGDRAGPRSAGGRSPGGDPQFTLDVVAEAAVADYVRGYGRPLAVYTEDAGLTRYGSDPEQLVVVDPIDGTRGAMAGLECAMFSAAVAPLADDARIGDVTDALLMELKGGARMYAASEGGGIESDGYGHALPALSATREIEAMFWSFELNGHPMDLMTAAYGHLVDRSANTGGVFVFNSASYSLSRVVTGQLDAYVDIGNRLLRDRPELSVRFEEVGGGHVLHLFPYDIAAAVLIAKRAGVTVTDGYGEPLDSTLLLDLSAQNQQSCVAAATPELHERLIESIRW